MLPHHGLGPQADNFPCSWETLPWEQKKCRCPPHQPSFSERICSKEERKDKKNEWDREILPQVLPQLKASQWSSKKPFVRKKKKNTWPIQCHLTILAPFCSSLELLFQSGGGDAPFLLGCPSPAKQEDRHINTTNNCQKPYFYSGHFVLQLSRLKM